MLKLWFAFVLRLQHLFVESKVNSKLLFTVQSGIVYGTLIII